MKFFVFVLPLPMYMKLPEVDTSIVIRTIYLVPFPSQDRDLEL